MDHTTAFGAVRIGKFTCMSCAWTVKFNHVVTWEVNECVVARGRMRNKLEMGALVLQGIACDLPVPLRSPNTSLLLIGARRTFLQS